MSRRPRRLRDLEPLRRELLEAATHRASSGDASEPQEPPRNPCAGDDPPSEGFEPGGYLVELEAGLRGECAQAAGLAARSTREDVLAAAMRQIADSDVVRWPDEDERGRGIQNMAMAGYSAFATEALRLADGLRGRVAPVAVGGGLFCPGGLLEVLAAIALLRIADHPDSDMSRLQRMNQLLDLRTDSDAEAESSRLRGELADLAEELADAVRAAKQGSGAGQEGGC